MMESVTNAVTWHVDGGVAFPKVSLAASAASLASDAVATAPLWAQLQLILSAALRVAEAFWLLLVEALQQLARAVLAHPKLAVAVVGVPVVSLALNVGRWRGPQRDASRQPLGCSVAMALDSECRLRRYSAAMSRAAWPQALELFEEMRKQRLEPNSYSHCACMGSLQRSAQWSQALGLLHPSRPSVNSGCAACREEWPRALLLMKSLEEPDLVSRLARISQVLGPSSMTFSAFRGV